MEKVLYFLNVYIRKLIIVEERNLKPRHFCWEYQEILIEIQTS